MKHFLNYINGEFVATDKTFENRAPVDNHVIGLVHEAGAPRLCSARSESMGRGVEPPLSAGGRMFNVVTVSLE